MITINNAPVSEDQINAFWSKVAIADNARDCWEWTGARKNKGYGNVRINEKYLIAHRVAFSLVNGPIPEGFIVCHICDNPPCCNPNHLMLGTIKSNAADMLLKNRQKSAIYAARGQRNGNSKLNKEAVLEIRRSYKKGLLSQYQLADKFNVSQSTIYAVLNRKTWRHV